MRTPDNHIVLIDFNIALSLGEDTVMEAAVPVTHHRNTTDLISLQTAIQ